MDDNTLTHMVPDERQRLIESLLRDGSTHLWVADEFFPHIQAVLERIPLDYLRKLADKEFLFLAPERYWGRVTQWQHNLAVGDFVVFLSPELLTLSEEEIRTVIAHELAHLVLDHTETPSQNAYQEAERDECQADALSKCWGFNSFPNKHPL